MTLIGFHALSLVHKMGTLWVKKKDGYPSFYGFLSSHNLWFGFHKIDPNEPAFLERLWP